MSLTALAYHINRVITILGVQAMLAAVVAHGTSALDANMAVMWLLARMIAISGWWMLTTGREFSHSLALNRTRKLRLVPRLRSRAG